MPDPFAGSRDPTTTTAPSSSVDPDAASGSLVVGPGISGRVTVFDGVRNVAEIDARPADRALLRLPTGQYSLRDATGRELATVDVTAGETTQFAPAGAMVAEVQHDLVQPHPADDSTSGPELQQSPGDTPRTSSRWRRIASPAMAAALPGLGHMVNRRVGKGVGILLGTVGMGLGSAALYAAGTRGGRAITGAGAPSFARDAARLGAIGALTGGLQLLYAGQIMDAYALASRKTVRPKRDFKIAFEITRMATVGMNARDEGVSLYRDWSFSMMGQVAKRLTVGISDVSLKTNWFAGRTTMQAGARLGYRFYDRDRLWLGAAAGALVQGSFRDIAPSDYNTDAEWQSEQALTAAPYLQFETRWFFLDRWSVHVMPRVSVPFGTRYYSGPRSIPSHAVTFELGSGIGVQF